MSQQEIEVILSRQLAEYLEVPIFIVDPDGDLLYYNEPAEAVLGIRYAETGPLSASDWSTIFKPVDHQGQPMKPEELPLMIALTQQVYDSSWLPSDWYLNLVIGYRGVSNYLFGFLLKGNNLAYIK